MPMTNAARIYKLKRQEEDLRAARAIDQRRDGPQPGPNGPANPDVVRLAEAAQPAQPAPVPDAAAGPKKRGPRDATARKAPSRVGRAPGSPSRAGTQPTDNPKAEAAVERLKEKLDQKAAQRTEEEQAEIDQARAAVQEPDPDEIDPEVGADLEAAGELEKPVRDQKGLFVEGNPGGPGRPPGSKNMLPRGTKEALKEMIEGRILQDGKAAAEILSELLFKGMNGEIVIAQSERGTTYANPLGFAKLYTEYMLKSEALEAAKARRRALVVAGSESYCRTPSWIRS